MSHQMVAYLDRNGDELEFVVDYAVEDIRPGRSNCEPGDAEPASGGGVVMYSIWHGPELARLTRAEENKVIEYVEESHVYG